MLKYNDLLVFLKFGFETPNFPLNESEEIKKLVFRFIP